MANQDYMNRVGPTVDEKMETGRLHFPTCVAAPSTGEGGEASPQNATMRPKIYGRSVELKRLQTLYEAVSKGQTQAGVSSSDSGRASTMAPDGR